MAELFTKERERNTAEPKIVEDIDMLSKYMYPTMIILPIVVVVILILASKAHIAIKIITILLLVIVIFVYHLQQSNTDILKYIQTQPEDVSYKA
jgi:ABC-type transport system involved in cytochrome bd biosynthesis fused ATPase/permease subunit